MHIKVAIVDDHVLILNGLKTLLNDNPDIQVTGTYLSGASLMEGLKQNELPDILLMDINLPDKSGSELLRMVLKKYPQLKVIALTNMDTLFHIKDMMQHGCKGYVTKQAREDVLVQAIKQVYQDAEFLEDNIKDRWMQSLLKSSKEQFQITPLSRREKEILKLIAHECTTQEIADKLFLSYRTVESHRYNLLQKLNVKNSVGLVRVAMEMGLLE